MTPDLAADLLRNALIVVVRVVALLIVPGLLVSLMISVIQAATQINEQSLTVLPRLIVTLLVMAFMAHWLIRELNDFFLMVASQITRVIV